MATENPELKHEATVNRFRRIVRNEDGFYILDQLSELKNRLKSLEEERDTIKLDASS
jgi:hypothetical protein